ncbi:hypothetical protein CYANOKiyG1_03820 [Okeania sp. KiyG1]|nr:hypothetical protein CYANOKiyG1_03820 [Okeania sp. KiyG1]
MTYSLELRKKVIVNDIEHDFSALKRARMYAPSHKSLDEIIRDYCIA